MIDKGISPAGATLATAAKFAPTTGRIIKPILYGDPSTIWHTMYSVTVAKYPHWVDLDAGEVKEIKGFTYLPRQNGNNGNIKDYSIQVSMDGKEWGDPVKKKRKGNCNNHQSLLVIRHGLHKFHSPLID